MRPANPEATTDFFVSYNKADKAWAEWIAWQFEEAEYTTIIQAWDFAAGGNFVLEMDRAAKQARRTVAVLSPDYLAAQYAQPEWAAAFVQDPTGKARLLVPVRVRECQPDGLLTAVTWVDLVGLDEPTAKQTLLSRLKGERLKPSTAPGFPGKAPHAGASVPVFPGLASHEAPPEFGALRDAIAAGSPLPELDWQSLEAVLRHSPTSMEEYRLARIAEWSQEKYELDRRFTKLTLLLDQGPQAEGGRWQAQPQSFDDLRKVLAEAREPAAVLLGPPGCGKSTLLRRLELDLARDALSAAVPGTAALSFFLPLNLYRPTREGEPTPTPLDWLAGEWAERYPRLPPLADLLQSGKLVLLLDAINEIPHAGEEDYDRSSKRWRDFLVDLGRTARGTRVVFSCRSLDYTAVLSTPELAVPHVRIERLGEAQVEEFLTLYNAEHGPKLWRRLKGTPQFDLFRSPFYLKMLLAQVGPDGAPPAGRAALFTGFVRQALHREVVADNPPFRRGALLEPHDYDRIIPNDQWRDDVELPDDSPVLQALCRLAFELQRRRSTGDVSRVRARRKEVIALLGEVRGDALLRAGVALQVLEEQFGDVFYAHQLLQEYFAARALAAAPNPGLARSAWRAGEMSPALNQMLHSLADSDPLPAAPGTGWEETFVLAAAMAAPPEAFIAGLAEANLPLAGRCAAQPDVEVSAHLRQRLQSQLIERSRDPQADLRARIAAARALGELGDPRFEHCAGPHGDYLLPPMVPIEGGEYSIGSDEGHYENEAPVHPVKLAPFALGRFPVTNVEWRLFMDAGGYDDERWWETEPAKRWRRGEDTAEGPKAQSRELRNRLKANPALPRQQLNEGRITSAQAQDWEWFRNASDAAFEAQLDQGYPAGRRTQPAYWDDPAYNHPAQPVVGICWYEARAYCAWLSAQMGRACRLPTEAEWEAAARGRPARKWFSWRSRARRYPWGDDFDAARCNVFETHVRGTTPIGVFPGGDTPEDLSDMTGNVWDWTSSLCQPYRYVADDGREGAEADGPRVVRGGSWSYARLACSAAARYPSTPGNRPNDLGFRLCFVPPIN